MSGGGRTRAPIALQLVALLVVSLIAAQVMTFAVVVLMPPPPRAVYRIEDVAQALKGGSLTPRFGRPLLRQVQAAPPPEPASQPFPREHGASLLAALLGVREADVRLAQHLDFPSRLHRSLGIVGPHMNMRRQVLEGPGGRPPPGEGPPPPSGTRRDVFFAAGPGQPAQIMTFHDMGPPLLGEFSAAVRQSDGRWLVVRPLPEPIPNDWQRRVLLWLGGCLLLVAPLGYFFARRITAPLEQFARAAETLGRDPSGPLMALSGPAEVGAAARAFNDMQVRLKRFIDDRTAMVGAISHDLRTPLARIRFKLEGAPGPVKDAVLADVAQMEAMISSVLAFIRDASAARPRERLDLLSLLECLVDDAGGQDLTVVEDSAPVTVEADTLGLQRLFGNLLDNAVKYGARGRVRVFQEDGHAVVEIADDGPGLAQSELERVFLPFYRAEAARTLDGGGVGLGLAVARSIARAHGGDVVLVSTAMGLVARVRLPLSAA
ncbi:ATP-binding protein [Phenylobacterium sp.]|uniref:ATP-binding protein n=1 Tax=Phenylobacterium sp. TaxID=1871053 RepID=UPI002728B803|nr:ATP-binding protein [Phenylobacterium sp.]MDO8800718.1 ATP-binding protein [Phenylobacterium sp.]